MFGHNDDQPQPAVNDTSDNQGTSEPPANNGAMADPAAQSTDPSAHPIQAWQHPGAPLDTPADTPAPGSAISTDHTVTPPGNGNAPVADDLIDLKQKALGQLTPLVGHLDQSPEEKFRTLMMMIQATDDQSMLQEAYDTAQKITDEKTKAQALLDVVNEINYFTQHKS